MKLNKKIRNQFVAAVEAALPPVLKFDFESWGDRYKEMLERNVAKDVKAFHAKYPGALLMTQESIFISERVRRHHGAYQEIIPKRVLLKTSAIYFGVTRDSPEIQELRKAATTVMSTVLDAEEERYELLNRLKEVVGGCKTDADLRAALPDLAHLIPAPTQPVPLPVVQRGAVITDLIKAGLKVPRNGETK